MHDFSPKTTTEIIESDSPADLGKARRDALTGTVLMQRYTIDELIATGGMGRVYRGTHIKLGKPVAIKLLHSHLLASTQAADRFFKEAQAASKLQHPAIAAVSDYGTADSGEPFIVMDYIKGQSLAQLLTDRKLLDTATTLRIASSVLSALSHCHIQGIVHRDLKPSNIILASDEDDAYPAKLVDFGIAKLAREESEAGRVTATGEIFGSPYYMSPEQCQSSVIDARTDIYALGCVLYECLSGEPPFCGRNLIEVLLKQCNEPAPTLFDRAADCPQYLSDIIGLMLAKAPDDRPASAEQVLVMLSTAERQNSKSTPVLISKSTAEKFAPRPGNATSGNTSKQATPADHTLAQKIRELATKGAPGRQKLVWPFMCGVVSLAVIAGVNNLLWQAPKETPRDEFNYRPITRMPSQTAIAELDDQIEKAEVERMRGEFLGARQSFEKALYLSQLINTASPRAVNDRAALIKMGLALTALKVKDLDNLHISPAFGQTYMLGDMVSQQDLAIAETHLREAVEIADNATVSIINQDSENTLPKLGQKLKCSTRIYLAAVLFLTNDVSSARTMVAECQELMTKQPLVLNYSEADLFDEVKAELLWLDHKWSEAAQIYLQSPLMQASTVDGKPDSRIDGKYISANKDYKLTISRMTAHPIKTTPLAATWQNLTLTAPKDAPQAVKGTYVSETGEIELPDGDGKMTRYIMLHMGKSVVLKTKFETPFLIGANSALPRFMILRQDKNGR